MSDKLGEPKRTMEQLLAEEALETEFQIHASDCFVWATRDLEDCDCDVRLQGMDEDG